MDRVAQLAEEADDCIVFERMGLYPAQAARAATREHLADFARLLGFPANEISPAIDTALRGR